MLKEQTGLDEPQRPSHPDLDEVVAAYFKHFPQGSKATKERLTQLREWAYQDFGALLAQGVPKRHVIEAIRASPAGSMPRDCVRTYQRMHRSGEFDASDEYEYLAERVANANLRGGG